MVCRFGRSVARTSSRPPHREGLVIRVVVSGICGRMGSLAADAIAAAGDLNVAAGLEAPGHPAVGRTVLVTSGRCGADVPVRGSFDDLDPSSYDVVVDFSTPVQAHECARAALARGKGLVVGTTGLSDAGLDAVRAAAVACPVVLAPNASLGANVLFGVVGRLAGALGREFDVEIVEAHHRAKKDAPSGTAVRIADLVCRARGAAAGEGVRHGRSGREAQRKPGEVGIHSVRGGSVVGRHEVRFTSDLEEITVGHEAFTRAAFASGAAAAARFVVGRAPGLYDMRDVLGLRDGEGA
jgi:4-hydroxy-tetrahydrodipicolinate reductase